MSRRHIWLIALVVGTLLVAACGPEMITPTPIAEPTVTSPSSVLEATVDTPEPSPSPFSGEYPVHPDDWHVLGSPDAPVTILDYSDFQ
jgi:hypothetical protein